MTEWHKYTKILPGFASFNYSKTNNHFQYLNMTSWYTTITHESVLTEGLILASFEHDIQKFIVFYIAISYFIPLNEQI